MPSVLAATDEWTPAGSMDSARAGHSVSLLPNGMILVAGGQNGQTSFPKSTKIYNPAADSWTTGGSMGNSRAYHTATLLNNGKLLVAGGMKRSIGDGSDVAIPQAELYDPATGQWTATGTLNVARGYHTATLLSDGKVLVTGGQNDVGRLSSVELYDPTTGTWMSPHSMSVTRAFHTATLLQNGKVLVVGGIGTNGSLSPIFNTAELYDPTTGTWTATASMSGARYRHTATILSDGKVLITGGSNGSPQSSAALYSPATGTWSTTGSMSTARVGHTTTLLSNGKVLVAGAATDSASSELYNPSNGTWAATGSMNAFRHDHAATLLPDGSVMAVGGKDLNQSSYTYFSTSEIYEYASVYLILNALHGQISGDSSPYLPNTSDTLTAAADPGYVFTGWSGDATGTDNPITIVMNVSKAIQANFSPDTRDDDDDGFSNFEEIVTHLTNPTLWDTDGDGVKDSTDVFPLNPSETLDTDKDGIGDNADTDDDGDGYSDADEVNIHGTNPKRADSDGDGLSDPTELQTHQTNPNLADTDNDGLSDGSEVNTHSTLPKVADTDGDGFLDGYEVLTGKSPIDILDKPALVAEARTAIEFTFPAAMGKTYRIEASFDLNSWETVESGIPGSGSTIQRFYTTRGMPRRYFRVEEDTP